MCQNPEMGYCCVSKGPGKKIRSCFTIDMQWVIGNYITIKWNIITETFILKHSYKSMFLFSLIQWDCKYKFLTICLYLLNVSEIIVIIIIVVVVIVIIIITVVVIIIRNKDIRNIPVLNL